MKIAITATISIVIGLLLGSCDIAGPAYPEKNGREYLENRGYSDDLISRLIDGKTLEPSEVQDFQASGSSDVRFLVARNPTLTHSQIDVSISSKDDFTRSGAALSQRLLPNDITAHWGQAGMTARVRGVIAAPAAWGLRLNVSSSMSANTAVALASATAVAVARIARRSRSVGRTFVLYTAAAQWQKTRPAWSAGRGQVGRFV
jgi:hypothetical protein